MIITTSTIIITRTTTTTITTTKDLGLMNVDVITIMIILYLMMNLDVIVHTSIYCSCCPKLTIYAQIARDSPLESIISQGNRGENRDAN